MLARLGLRTRIFLLFLGLAGGALAALAGGLAAAYSRLADPALLNGFVQAGMFAGFAILGLVTWLWYLFDINVAKPIDILAGALRSRAHADVNGAVDATIARYLGDLAPAAQAAAESLAETRNALAEVIARETSRLTAEKQRLEALLSDVPVGVLLCSGDHQLVFYNGQAFDLIGSASAGPKLDRPLFDYLRDGPIRMAHARLVAIGEEEAASDLLCATVSGGSILSARMRLIEAASPDRPEPGYVLTLRDVTADLAATATREAFFTEVFDRIKRPAANLATLMAALPEGAAVPGRVDTALREEVAALADTVTDLSRRRDAMRADMGYLSFTRASDLIDGLKARIEAAGLTVLAADFDGLLMRCNGFDLASLLGRIATSLRDEGLASAFRLGLLEEEGGAALRLSWQGATLPVARLEAWLREPLDRDLPDVTGRTVLRDHSTEIWPETADGWQSIYMPIPNARREVRRPPSVARAVVYDFDLLGKARNTRVADSNLDDLTYVVFDTETTGLLPQQGDEIVQIAAVRIVNGRLVEGEVFDTLVNPARPIPPGSTEVHGITDAMVADAPSVDEVLRRFHKFAEDAVLVAHNAPFDMQFLRRREDALGLRFDHAILDTVLLSAVVYGQHEVHSLDALSHRLGITIPEEARHTAIGDTVATANVFLKLVKLLRGRGLATFSEVVTEVRRHRRLLKDLNEPLQ